METLAAVERALRAASPHALLDVATSSLGEYFGALDAALHMADCSVRTLQRVEEVPGESEPLPLHGTPEGRAFSAVVPVVDADGEAGTVTVRLPVGVRGDRFGVLTVTLPADRYDETALLELTDFCEVLGHEILLAERDTDLFVLARRVGRLTLAAEMQWQLLPGRSMEQEEFALGAHLEPAYAIFGDCFDWSVSDTHLTVTVVNGMGDGVHAALLANLTLNALRNARRAGVGLADQVSLADQAVFAHYGGSEYVHAVLLRIDLATGETEAVDAGSPRVWRLRDGDVERILLDDQLPLGMFGDSHYDVEYMRLRPRDRLLVATDGVYGAVPSTSGTPYGDDALVRALRAGRLLPAAQVPRLILRDLSQANGSSPLRDDALVVCADWFGPAGGEGAPGAV